MSRESALETISKSMYTLMEVTRKSRGPIKTFRMRDLHLLKFVYFECEAHKTTMTKLANFLNITPAAASQIITSYEKKGWVERERSTTDRRTVYVKLTKKTKTVIEEKWNTHQARVMDFLEGLTDEECDCLESIVHKITEYMETHND